MTVSVLFVCLGNICRSPTAEAVFRERVIAAGLEAHIRIDSAGTGDWHIGRAPDPRTREAAARRGYQMDTLRARQVSPQDFYEFDVVLAMDNTNLADLQAMQPADVNVTLGRFLDYSTASDTNAREMNFTSQIKWDLGPLIGATAPFYVGMEYAYWNNKFGIDGVNERNPCLLVKWHF